ENLARLIRKSRGDDCLREHLDNFARRFRIHLAVEADHAAKSRNRIAIARSFVRVHERIRSRNPTWIIVFNDATSRLLERANDFERAVQIYDIVVREFLALKLLSWLNTVCRHTFKIEVISSVLMWILAITKS